MRSSLAVLLLSACLGPAAPDQDLCIDVISRLCLTPICPDATRVLAVDAAICVQTLSTRTRCDEPTFVFNSPSRARVLECRAPLVKTSALRTSNPACSDVTTLLNDCPDVVSFLNGG